MGQDRFPPRVPHLILGHRGIPGEIDHLRRQVGIAVSAIETTLGGQTVLPSDITLPFTWQTVPSSKLTDLMVGNVITICTLLVVEPFNAPAKAWVGTAADPERFLGQADSDLTMADSQWDIPRFFPILVQDQLRFQFNTAGATQGAGIFIARIRR